MYNTEASRWRAIQTRDQAASSAFVYAVVSTKIYCRPACPSRVARRANVCFYDAAEDAAAAGFRPCLRCKPNEASFVLENHSAPRDAVRRACEYIKETKGQAKFADVAQHVGLSTRYLYGLFKSVMGTTPAKYGASFRPEQKIYDSFEAPAVSEAISPATAESTQQLVSIPVWDNPLNLDYADFATLQATSQAQLQHNNVYSASLLAPGMSAKHIPATETVQFMPYSVFNMYPSGFYSMDPTLNLYRNGEG